MQKCEFNFIETILPQGYSSVNMLCACCRMLFLENLSGELLLYIFLNIEVINVEVLSKKAKQSLKYISIL